MKAIRRDALSILTTLYLARASKSSSLANGKTSVEFAQRTSRIKTENREKNSIISNIQNVDSDIDFISIEQI